MKFRLFLLSFLCLNIGFSQNRVDICLGDNADVCPSQTVRITNCSNVITPGPNAITLQNPTNITFSPTDDRWSRNVIPIGFTFNFYGVNYTNCVVGSNGLIGFDVSKADEYCEYSLSASNNLPSSSHTPAARNTFMGCYQDVNPGLNNASVVYETIGTAPNRKFVVLFNNVYFFSCTSVCNYFSMILYEGTNELEAHIGNKPVCGTFNGGLAIQGVQNAAGTEATITPGRNISVWTANQDSRRFRPASPTNTTNYTVDQIPYTMVVAPNGSIEWIGTDGTHVPYNNGVLNLTNVPSGRTGYYLSGTACGAPLGAISDTSWITSSAVNGTITNTPDFCSTSVGTATVTATGTGPFTYLWSPSNQTTATATNLSGGTHTVVVTNAAGCTKTFLTSVANNTARAAATTTRVSCPGGSDGTATASITPANPNTVYDWYDLGNQTTATVTGLSAGTYHCRVTSGSGCTDTVAVTITEVPAMTVTTTAQTDVTCHAGSDGVATVAVANGNSPYAYAWQGSSSTTATATDLPVGSTVVTVTDSKGCTTQHTVTLGQPDSLYVSYISPDVTICPGDSAIITANGSGGSSAYIYNWYSEGTLVGTGQTVTVSPAVTGTYYKVVLTETCGSPQASDSMIITFPTPLIPSLVPDAAQACQPGAFFFRNTTNDSSEIATTYIDFGNGSDTLVQGYGPVSSLYPEPNRYTVNMIVTSVHGCVYTNTLPNIVETLKNPTAYFTASANPATIFETNIKMNNNSSMDVVDWKWSAPDAVPAQSTMESPVFYFPEGEIGDYPVTLVTTSSFGCVDTFTTIIHIVNDILFYAPNAFTPDGNEYNQTWKLHIDGIDIHDFSLAVYNRWGQLIWETKDPSADWDGTYNGELVQEGTYMWKARVKSAYSDEAKTFNGFVSLLR